MSKVSWLVSITLPTWVLVGASLVNTSLVNTSLVSASEAQRRHRTTDYGVPQVEKINSEIRQVWSEFNLKPSSPADDGEWCRRIYLDVIGRVPSFDELQEFLKDKSADRKSNLVNKLLFDDEYTEEYARNWTTIWTNVLIGRAGGTERNTLTSRAGMQKYLRDSLARNRPYNDMVYDMVTATGTNTPGSEDFNGAVNFLAMKVNDEKGTLATAATAKIFLGLQVQCTQCHNHPFNEWKQRKFWELNAFFRQTRALRQFALGTNSVAGSQLVDEDFRGEDTNGDPTEAAIYYELRNGLLRVAYPVFIDGTTVGRSGLVRELNRREQLGKLILQSEYLDKMVANRYWAHFMGYGFTKPIDDMGPHNSPSHPALLDYLGQEFRSHSYNLKELIRWITLSEAYSLSSKMTRSNTSDDPSLGEPPKFSHFYLRQMRAEELYESLLVVTQAESRGSFEEQEREKARWLSQFVMAFGNDEGQEATTFNGAIPQALMMFNGALIRNATSAQRGGFLWELANSKLEWGEQIEYLFLIGLAREPIRDEFDIANKLLLARARDQVQRDQNRNPRRRPPVDPGAAAIGALQDVWWAVLNSNEFIINH